MRIKWIDQYKGIIALLVVIGHMLVWCTCLQHDAIFGIVYTLIYTFHMPAFFLIAGYVDKTKVADIHAFSDVKKLIINKKTLKRAINMLVPTIVSYLILVSILTVFSILPLQKALIEVNYWFIWTMIIISVTYPTGLAIFRSSKKFAVILLCVMFLVIDFSEAAAKFVGYYFCYVGGSCITNFMDGRVIKFFYKFKYVFLIVYLLIVILMYKNFSDTIVLNPIYKCIFGFGVSLFVLIWCFYSESTYFLTTGGTISLFMYLFQISAFEWLLYVFPKDNMIISGIGVIAFTAISFFIPIWIYQNYKDTKIYRLIFSPYRYVEKYLPYWMKQ